MLAANPVQARPEQPASASPGGTVVHVAEFGAPYPGSFMSSLQALEACLQLAGMRQVLVLPARARQRTWVETWRKENRTPIFFMSEAPLWRRAKEVASIL